MSAKSRNIEDTYPLSPMQEGLLFHSLYSPHSGVYVTQVTCKLRNLDVSALEQAWRQIMERHTILRTAFVWKNLDQPMQVVGRQVGLPLEQQDWRGMSAREQQERFEAHLQSDRDRGFEFSRAPLMRLTLLQLDETTYRLVWSHHHILLDGWSLRLMIKELFAAYESICHNQNVNLDLSRPYRDYIAWLQKQDIAEAEQFWKKFLKGFSAPTSFGVERNNGNLGDQKNRYEELRARLPEKVTASLQSLSRQHQLTMNTIVQGALGLLLSRYSGEEDVVFGSVVSGRPAEIRDVQSMVGLFVNTLPARIRLDSRTGLTGWLKQLQEQQVEMRRFEFSPLVKIQGWSEVARSSPMFDTLFAFENYPANPVASENRLSVEVSDFRVVERDNFPLTIFASPGTELGLKFLYDSGRYEPESMNRMLGHLQTLLKGFADDPAQPVTDVPMLSEDERKQVVVEWNDRALAYPKELCMHQLFEAQVEKTPEATALIFENEQLSYNELNCRANQLAHHLQKLGVGPEVFVGISLERSVEMIVGILAILKAGGVYVPLDPAYPKERLDFILDDTRAPVLLTQERLVSQLTIDNSRLSIVCLDADWEKIASESESNPSVETSADNLAYVIYTSGSTGRPKGVAIEHRNAGALIHWAKEVFSPEDIDGMLTSTSICFDLSVFELFVALSWGGKIILAENALQLPNLPAANAVTLINTVPSAMAELVRLDGVPSSVRTVNLAGEPLQTKLVKQIYQLDTVKQVYDLYGPSEDTTYSTFALRSATGPYTIGRPIANTQVYLLNRTMQATPVGVIGQLHIGGHGLARGYLKRPDMTAEKWLPNPFAGEPGARLYDTGDLARFMPDGNIEFLGRKDHQVKIRGFRIELGEIETALDQHPEVQDVVVLAREDMPGDPATSLGAGKRLVAYIVSSPNQPTIADLRNYLLERLPDYMLPSVFVMLDALPRTPNGKVDRKALPAPESVRSERDAAFATPRNPIEEALVAIYTEVLGLDRVGIHENFFELGGHSLLATQVISRVRAAFQVELPLHAIFETPAVVGLAERIETARQAEKGLQAPPIRRISRDEALPLSYAQQRLWFLDQFSPDGTFYNLPAALRLNGPLNVAALEECLNEIVRRHEVLRTTFSNVKGRPVQVISPAVSLKLPLVDLKALSGSKQERELLRLATAEAQRPFDLARGPLFRTTLVQLAAEEHAVLFTMHHIVSDGWSIGVLIKEVALLYEAFSRGLPSPLSDLQIQYADFAHWQQQWLQGEVLEKHLSYWQEQLAESSHVLELPTDRPRPAVQTFRGAVHPITLPRELSEALKELSRREGVTLYMTLLAAFQTLLYHYTGQTDILIGSPIAGRTRSEIEDLIGLFINNLVLRSDFSDKPTFRELLRRVRKVTLDAYAHQDMPFEQLVDALQPNRSLSHSPLFQVMFVLQNAPREALELPGLTLSPLQIEGRIAKFDLTLAMTDTEQGLIGSMEYNTDLFDADTLSRMVQHFQTLLESVIAAPKQSVSALPLMSEHESDELLVKWNDTSVDYGVERCVHRLFEAQVERTPDHVAIVSEDGQLTYRQLNDRANQLAHHLQKLGVAEEALVGICMDRSIEMMVGIIGVLKAGGAYVPLDPSYPLERLAFMLEDSDVSVILSQERLVEALFEGGEAAGEERGEKSEKRDRALRSKPVLPAPILSGSGVEGLLASRCQVVCLDTIRESLALESAENPAHGATTDHPAYVIYTSGSTGRPKGVMVSHQAVCNHMLWLADHFALNESDRFLQKTAFSFDAAGTEFYAPLFTGGCLILAQPGGHQDSSYLVRAITEHRITILQLVPSLLRVLLDEPEFEECDSLRRIICAGEALPAELQKRVSASLKAELHNFYGPTEAAIDVTYWPHAHASGRPIVPIGRPLANTEIYLLSSDLQPVPVGVPGELHIGGDNLARGYLKRPELTAERFIPHVFGAEGKRLYKTGDLARYLADGNIEFLGRIDHQVKVRGFRIEPGEIEAVLRNHPALEGAVVLAREDTPDDTRLVAYLVASEQPAPTIGELRDFMREQLPEYMVPSAFVFLEALPLAPNGKIDRRALPEPEKVRPDLEAEFVAPRTPTEEKLAEIWTQLLGVDKAGIYDNFFELGGHSLLATQFVSRVRETFEVELSLISLFETPVIADLAEKISQSELHDEKDGSRIERLQRGEKSIEELVAEMDQLSDDEVQALLEEDELKVVTDKDK